MFDTKQEAIQQARIEAQRTGYAQAVIEKRGKYLVIDNITASLLKRKVVEVVCQNV